MTFNPENENTMDIYHILDDGRIVELRLGRPSDCDDVVWARNLSAGEKEIYLQLKQMGSSDQDIYYHLKQHTESDLSPRS
jgi:hypothetical protein